MNSKGLLVVISGFSGVGKGTVIQMVLDRLPNLKFSISCTTRAPRMGEESGVNYFFMSEKEFESRIAANEFLEYTKTFTNYYGTLKSEIETPISAGIDVLLELNVVGAKNLKKKYPECITIFLTPPSIDALKARLVGRGTESAESLEHRIKEIETERHEIENYDYVITNNVAQICAEEIVHIILSEHLKTKRVYNKNLFDKPEEQ